MNNRKTQQKRSDSGVSIRRDQEGSANLTLRLRSRAAPKSRSTPRAALRARRLLRLDSPRHWVRFRTVQRASAVGWSQRHGLLHGKGPRGKQAHTAKLPAPPTPASPLPSRSHGNCTTGMRAAVSAGKRGWVLVCARALMVPSRADQVRQLGNDRRRLSYVSIGGRLGAERECML